MCINITTTRIVIAKTCRSIIRCCYYNLCIILHQHNLEVYNDPCKHWKLHHQVSTENSLRQKNSNKNLHFTSLMDDSQRQLNHHQSSHSFVFHPLKFLDIFLCSILFLFPQNLIASKLCQPQNHSPSMLNTWMTSSTVTWRLLELWCSKCSWRTIKEFARSTFEAVWTWRRAFKSEWNFIAIVSFATCWRRWSERSRLKHHTLWIWWDEKLKS